MALVPFNNRHRGMRPAESNNLFNMIDNFFNDSSFPAMNSFMDTFKVDVKEKDDKYLVEAELPGVDKENIDLQLNDGHLVISVNQEDNVEDQDDDGSYIHKERHFSSMQRSVYLDDAKPDGVKAKLDDGLLKITVDKEDKEASNTRQIEIE